VKDGGPAPFDVVILQHSHRAVLVSGWVTGNLPGFRVAAIPDVSMLSLTHGQAWEQLHVECRAIGRRNVGVVGAGRAEFPVSCEHGGLNQPSKPMASRLSNDPAGLPCGTCA
jgi:hypothetical protein